MTLEFNTADAQTPETLKPLYDAMLHGKAEITLTGAETLDAAKMWLLAQHTMYCAAVGKRSALIQNMKPLDRVTFPQFEEPAP